MGGLEPNPPGGVDLLLPTLVTWLLTMLCKSHYFANPYFVSKLVEVLFVVNPAVQEKRGELYALLMLHPICSEFLPSTLMRFYTKVEQRGSSMMMNDTTILLDESLDAL